MLVINWLTTFYKTAALVSKIGGNRRQTERYSPPPCHIKDTSITLVGHEEHLEINLFKLIFKT